MISGNKIIIASGGTGGHVFPALTVGNELSKENDVLYFTDTRGQKYFGENKPYEVLNVKGLSGGFINKIVSLILVKLAVFRCLILIIKIKPNIIIGFGGYASFACVMAGIILAKKTIIHEQNAVLGQANRFLAKWASKIFISFPIQEKLMKKYVTKIYFTGVPLRKEFIEIKNKNLSTSTINILITGGSQATKLFSSIVPNSILLLPQQILKNLQIYHQAKEADIKEVQELYKGAKIKADVKPFFEDLPKLLQKANLVIARSGASTVAELVHTITSCILVPLKIAKENHQLQNALCFQKENSKKQFIKVIEEENFSVENLNKSLLAFFETALKDSSKNQLTEEYNATKRFAELLSVN